MSGAKLFRGNDFDLTPGEGGANVVAAINGAVSQGLGGGIGVFENCSIPWTVTYDEILFGIEGTMRVIVGDEIHELGPGDILWLPEGTELIYEADEKSKFFFAVNPAANSPSGAKTDAHPTVAPKKAT
jgi:ethanolamine utilization protein EutQ